MSKQTFLENFVNAFNKYVEEEDIPDGISTSVKNEQGEFNKAIEIISTELKNYKAKDEQGNYLAENGHKLVTTLAQAIMASIAEGISISETTHSHNNLEILENIEVALTEVLMEEIEKAIEHVDDNSVHKEFTFDQTSASDHWIIEHNLNKHPSITIVDSEGEVVFGDYKYISENKIEIYFSAPFSGKAYLN